MNNSLKELGLRVKTLREERGWTQHECAAFIGMHQSTVAHIESGDRNITMATLDQLVRGFGITFEELFEGM